LYRDNILENLIGRPLKNIILNSFCHVEILLYDRSKIDKKKYFKWLRFTVFRTCTTYVVQRDQNNNKCEPTSFCNCYRYYLLPNNLIKEFLSYEVYRTLIVYISHLPSYSCPRIASSDTVTIKLLILIMVVNNVNWQQKT